MNREISGQAVHGINKCRKIQNCIKFGVTSVVVLWFWSQMKNTTYELFDWFRLI